jgi:integrating conjugative element protein (TIGR03756 family)
MNLNLNSRPRLSLKTWVLALALSIIVPATQALETLNTGTIVSGAVSALPSCLRFRVVGVCIWLVCAGPFCKLKTSIKYGHRNPDLVVSVTNGLGKNPWTEANALYSALDAGGASSMVSSMGGSMLGGIGAIETGTSGAPDQNHGSGRKTNLSFRESQAIGHPLAGEIYCPSAASYLNAYYLSGLDAIGWRWQLPEVAYPQSLVPGWREIGNWPLNTWGSVYPRSGWITQTDQPKAAAVAAQRVGDIVTRGSEPHIYQELDSGGTFEADEKLVWRPKELEEGNDKTGDWQMMTPAMAAECEAFGANDTVSVGGWAGGKLASGGDYAWTLWRPYSCCQIKGVFLGAIDVFPYP